MVKIVTSQEEVIVPNTDTDYGFSKGKVGPSLTVLQVLPNLLSNFTPNPILPGQHVTYILMI